MKKKPAVILRTPDESKVRDLESRVEARQAAAPGAFRGFKRPDVPTSNAPEDRRIVVRKGRIRADGSRTEAPPTLRITAYLPPELGRALDVAAATTGREKSSIIAEALGAWLEANASPKRGR